MEDAFERTHTQCHVTPNPLVIVSFSSHVARVEYYPENVRSYRSRRLAVAVALIYVWLFFALMIFWVWRNDTGSYQRLRVPPYGSGTIHWLLCLLVVLTYVLGVMIVPRIVTVGMREGSLPSLVSFIIFA